MINNAKPIEIAENVYWVGTILEDDTFQCHAYLIVNAEESILIDSGSMIGFCAIKKKVESLISLKDIKYIVAHHQGPDVCANIPSFKEAIGRDDLLIVTHSRNQTLIKHYGIKSKYYLIDKKGFELNALKIKLEFLTTPYAYAPGAFVTYLPDRKVLFSGDIFGAIEGERRLYTQEDYFDKIKRFHQEYMPGSDVLNYALDKTEPLSLELIAPQHGSLIKKEYIQPVIASLRKLECGVYIDTFYKQSLLWEKEKLEKVLDMQEDIIFITKEKKELTFINRAFFKFSSYDNLEQLQKDHRCICELFLPYKAKGIIHGCDIENCSWIEDLYLRKEEQRYVALKRRDAKVELFEFNIEKFSEEEFLITLKKITQYKQSLDILELLDDIKELFISIISEQGEVLFANKTLLDFFEIEDFAPKKYNISHFLSTEQLKIQQEYMKSGYEESYELEYSYKEKFAPVVIRGKNGFFGGEAVRIAIACDVSKIKELEAQAREKDLLLFQQVKFSQIGKIMDAVADKWRQPIAAISASVIQMKMNAELAEITKKDIVSCAEFVQSKTSAMSKTIDLVRNYTQKNSENKKSFLLKDALSNAISTTGIDHEEGCANVKIYEMSQENTFLYGYQDLFEQVLTVVLENAKDICLSIEEKDKRKIEVVLCENTIEIIDYGEGLDRDEEMLLFTPHFTTKHKAGLSLYVGKKIMQEYFRGDITYKRVDGKTFFIVNFNMTPIEGGRIPK